MVFGKTPEIAPAPPPQCFKQPESRIMIQGTAVAPGQLRAKSYEAGLRREHFISLRQGMQKPLPRKLGSGFSYEFFFTRKYRFGWPATG